MPVNEEDVVNIMGGMPEGIRLNDHRRRLKNRFELCKKLGQGTYGKVQLGINKETGQRVAIKTIKKSKIETEADLIRIRREIQIMSSVQHPNIIHIYEVFENKEKMVLVMEIAAGGELYDYISDRKTLGEQDARRIFRQISTAIYYCHKHNICHRDLKLENILLDEDGGAKIADFGLSNVFDGMNLLKTFCGSPLYASPEIVLGCPYKGPEVDCWSLGVLLYTLVYGAMPFDGSNMKLLVRQIKEGNIFEPRPPSSASTLIRWMLTVKAENRATIVDICNHWWINEGYENGCLEEAEYLASLAPVRFDLLLSLNQKADKSSKGDPETEGEERDGKETPSVDIEEIPADTPIPDGVEECDVSVSEEPDDSPHRRRKKEKRKLDSSSTGGDAHVARKYERNEEVAQPPPPTYERAPEPMEAEQVYERPRERRKDDGRTPRVRRKHKSNEETIEEKDVAVTQDTQRKPPHKPKSPRPDNCDQNGELKKKSVRKEKRPKENGSEGFERPVPCASPRPPRTPPPPEWNEPDDCPPILEDTIPPPLPEKKRKSPAKNPELQPPCVELESQPVHEAPDTAKTTSKPHFPSETVKVQEIPPFKPQPQPVPSEADKQKKEEEEKTRTLERLVEAVQNGFSSVQSMVQSLPSGVPPPPEIANNANNVTPDCDLPAKDNYSVIAPIEPPCEPIGKLSGEEVVGLQTTSQDPHGSLPTESASGKHSWPAEPEKICQPLSSVGEAGTAPGLHLGQQSQDQNVPQSGQHSTESQHVQDITAQTPTTPQLTPTAPHTLPVHASKDNVLPLVKPFPSQPTNSIPTEFPPKGLASPEPISNKPPWVKDAKPTTDEKQASALPSSPLQKDAPSIPSSSSSCVNDPPNSINQKEHRGINNLPKLKIDREASSETDNLEIGTSNSQPPLVVPFPGRKGSTELVRQDSPKSLINNIPKPFKVESEKQPEAGQNEAAPAMQATEAPDVTPSPPSPQSVSPPVSAPLQSSVQAIAPAAVSAPQPSVPAPTPAAPPPPVSAPPPAPTPAPVLPVPKTPGLARSSPRPAQPIQYSNGTPRKSPLPQMKVESPSSLRHPGPKFPTSSRKGSTDSVGSAISLSSDGDHRSTPPSPMVIPKPNGPNINMSQLSPSSSGSNIGPDKSRDSKVIKAAAYWNNYIGEKKSQAKPPANPKTLEKPKKIVSAGIGENAMKDMTKAFESGKPIAEGDKFTLLRRNSKKMAVESINPGLRVNDAKSHFEKKAALQQPIETPRMTRRASGTLDKPKLSREENGTKSLLEPNPSNSASASKSPSPSRSEIAATKQESISKSPTPKTDVMKESDINKDAEARTKTEVQRNAVAVSPALPLTVADPEPKLKVEHNPTKEQQPKPPTSPKPKVRKEELKLREDQAKREDKPRPQLITKLKGDELNLVAPVKVNDKDVNSKAIVKSLKEEPEQFESKLEVNHKPLKEVILETDKENNEVTPTTPTTPLVKPILREKNRKVAEEGKTKEKETFIECRNVTKDPENGPPKLVIKTVKIKSPEPEKASGSSPPEQRVELSDVRSSLKRVPHVAVARRRSFTEKEEPPLEFTQLPSERKVVRSEIVIPVNATQPESSVIAEPSLAEKVQPSQPEAESEVKSLTQDNESAPKERVIPIQFINENRSLGPKPFKLETSSQPQTPNSAAVAAESASSPQLNKKEHHIPIVVEGRGSASKTPDEEQEKLDNFNTSSISRHRYGSRKKRMSSAFSDSSMSDDEALNTPFGGGANQGLQKGYSLGKHVSGEGNSNYALKKTRPPFSVTRQESFSSGEDDGLDDEGFQQISAENLFSTLLSRVKSLTRRIHDEHDEHLSWQQKQRHGPPKLNPGGTHARLERTAQRNSIKRDREPLPAAETATPSFSRQSSVYSRRDEPEPYSSNTSSLRSSYGNTSTGYEPRKIYNRSNSGQTDADSRYSTGSRYSTADRTAKRYDEGDSDFSASERGSVSVTSSQRLRPGYLPPPANPANSNAHSANSTANIVDPLSVAQTVINRAQEKSERSIPINIQRQNSGESPVSSKPGTPLPTPGVYNNQAKPFSPLPTNEHSRDQSRLESPEPLSEGRSDSRRKSRFLRPDFYETPKEDSIYAKMRDLEEDQKKMPRYLRGSNITRTTKSGRSTPLDYSTYNSEERTRCDTGTPRQDGPEVGAPATSEGRPHLRSLKKISVEETDHDQDILKASVNRLRREGMQRSTDASEISDGFKTPDSESITSDIFGVPDFVKEGEESFKERLQRSSNLSRVDENTSLGTSARPARRSVTNELFDPDRSARYTSARPVARRSVSRELFDLKYNAGRTSPYSPSSLTEPDPLVSPRYSRYSREGSSSRDSGLDPSASSLRASSTSRQDTLPNIRPSLPSRPALSTSGRSTTQSDLMRNSPLSHLGSTTSRYSTGTDEERFNAAGSIKDRKRDGSDWRRISVPERGKDFNSLPRKYTSRLNKNSYN